MKKVERSELLDYVTYTQQRPEIQQSVLVQKNIRRVHLGEYLTFLFENTETTKYQIQEMMRVERIVKEEAILHEMQTYNDILGGDKELGCTLMIEFVDPDYRDKQLRLLVGLPEHIYLVLEDGKKVYCDFDKNQVGDERVSSVQFLKFKCSSAPIKIGTDHPEMKIEQELSEDQKSTFKMDLQY
ncbi:MAG: DUF3501 family protein [Bdellovibrionaceae bacterium]|jgi:hypothetical protein|nr:DUF3501 family protein [Pseudobdellovibrionaceae bacterium]